MKSFVLLCLLLTYPAFGAGNPAYVDKAKALVSENMKDPSSVQWRRIKVVSIGSGANKITTVCGQFNAKNSYGAYVGFTDFYFKASDPDAVVETYDEEDPLAEAFHSVMSVYCTE